MNRYSKLLIAACIIALIITSIVAAGGRKETIDVMLNSINLIVNDQKVDADTIVYEGTTYVPLRATGEILGKEVGWDQETQTASINDKSAEESKKESNKITRDSDFRNVKWGMSINDVKRIENAELELEERDKLLYSAIISGYEVRLAYFFNGEGKLNEAGYAIMEEIPSDIDLKDFNVLLNAFMDGYGNVKELEILNPLNINLGDSTEWSKAFKDSRLFYIVDWEINDVLVMLAIRCEDSKIDFGTAFISKDIDAN